MTVPESRRPHHVAFARIGLGLLVALALLGAAAYGVQAERGLGETDLSREMPWGLYISQFTFLVGVGASAVTVLLPYYVHRQQAFARALMLGELVAVIAVAQAMLCVFVDLGRPSRLLNVILFPAPTSLMFWDFLTLAGYWVLSLVGLGLAWSERARSSLGWSRPLALATIPWAFGIHIVTALLYAGLAARPGWMTAVLAPRFLATAFASGPALLILLAGVLARTRRFDVGREAVARLTTIMTYAALTSAFLALLEVFTALYSGEPGASDHLAYLYVGLDGHFGLVPWAYASGGLLALALVVLLVPRLRARTGLAYGATAAVLAAVLIDKGLCFVTSGFNPSPLGYVRDYRPSLIELGIVAGIYASGALVFAGACRWLPVDRDGEPARLPEEQSVYAWKLPTSTAHRPDMAKVALSEK
jgi:molybdopterin-containing oxidoreductase family membrane subunit